VKTREREKTEERQKKDGKKTEKRRKKDRRTVPLSYSIKIWEAIGCARLK
jgi:hypothetical protein